MFSSSYKYKTSKMSKIFPSSSSQLITSSKYSGSSSSVSSSSASSSSSSSSSFSVHLCIYSVPNGKLASKLKILYFGPLFCPQFGPFCNFQSLYNLSTHRKVQFWYCVLCATIFPAHLGIYSVPNGKLASKFNIL